MLHDRDSFFLLKGLTLSISGEAQRRQQHAVVGRPLEELSYRFEISHVTTITNQRPSWVPSALKLENAMSQVNMIFRMHSTGLYQRNK
jgi:hypothetical protein